MADVQETDAVHRPLIDGWAQAQWETDANGVVVTDSPSWRAYTGQTMEEWLGYGWLDAIHPDDRAYAGRQWRDAVAACTVVDAEFRLSVPTGEWRWTNVRAVPVLDQDGQVTRWVGLNIDIDARKRAEAALRDSEALQRLALESGGMGAWRWDLQDRLIWGDAKFLALWGLVPSTDPHPLSLFTDRMSVDGVAEMEMLVGRAVEAGEEFDGQLEIVSGPTAGRWVRWRGQASASVPSTLHGVSFDVTDQRRADAARRDSEKRQAFLLELSDALRPLSDPEEVQRVSTRLLGRHLGASRVFYVVVEADGDTGIVHRDYTDGVPSRTGRYSLSSFSTDALASWRAGRIASTDDVDVDPRYSAAERAAYASVSTRAGVGVPLIKQGRLMAILGINQSIPRRWTKFELGLAGEVVDRTWAAVERSRAEAALLASEEKYRTVFESIDEGFAEVDLITDLEDRVVDWRYLKLNQAFTRMTGMTDVTGRLVSEILPGLEPDWAAHYTRLIESGEPVRFEEYAESIDMWFDVYASLVGGSDARRAVLIYNNITVRKRAEEAAATTQARQAFLLRLSDALRGEDCVDTVGRRAADMIAEKLGLDRVYLVRISPDDDAIAVTHETRRADLPPLKGTYRSSDFPAATRDILERTIVYDDARSDERLTDLDRASFAGLDAAGFMAASIRRGRETMIWAAGAVSTTPRRWSAAEVALFEDAVERTWAAIERARASSALKDREENLRLLVAELQHRVRNILTVTRLTFSRTFEQGGDLDEIASHFRGRLDAMARTQVMLTRDTTRTANLEDMIRDELLSVGAHEDRGVTLDGPDIALDHKVAEALGMALHELTTNALKYGALKVRGGKLDVSWAVNADKRGRSRLDLAWIERGVPTVPVQPSRSGFGRELIEEALPYRLKARTELTFGGGGVRCAISIPLEFHPSAPGPLI